MQTLCPAVPKAAPIRHDDLTCILLLRRVCSVTLFTMKFSELVANFMMAQEPLVLVQAPALAVVISHSGSSSCCCCCRCRTTTLTTTTTTTNTTTIGSTRTSEAQSGYLITEDEAIQWASRSIV